MLYLTNKIMQFQSNKKNYKDLVIPLVSQLVDALKNKHISDIKVYLVGITSKFPYPLIYDTDSEFSFTVLCKPCSLRYFFMLNRQMTSSSPDVKC